MAATPMTPVKIINLRGVQGVARGEDARLTQKGTWYATRNMWARNPGILAKRPGSTLILDGRMPLKANSWPAGGQGGTGTAVSAILIPNPLVVVNVPTAILATGTGGAAVISPVTLTQTVAAFVSTKSAVTGTYGLRPKVNI